MKKTLATLTFTAIALSAMAISGLMSRHSASAASKLNSSHTSAAPAAISQTATLTTQAAGLVMPTTSIYALNSDNVLFVLTPPATTFTRLVRVTQADGNLIGLDFRVSDGLLYALTDTGSIYTIDLSIAYLGAVTKVSSITPRFAGGFQSLMDFNPVLSAIRVIGSNDQNFAIVNSNGGNLNATAVQTAITYPVGDVNAGKDPNIACGSYTNNYTGATVTIFYAIDYDLDTFVTIQPATPGGSSATGGGKLQTIGPLVTPRGVPVNVSPTTDFDIFSNRATGANNIIGVSGRRLFTIDLGQINPALQGGQTQNVVVRGIPIPDAGGGFIDVAVSPY